MDGRPLLAALALAGAAAILALPTRAGAVSPEDGPVKVGVYDLSRVFEEAADLKKLLGEIRVLVAPREKALREEREGLESRLSEGGLDAAARQDLLKRLQGVLAKQVEVAKQADARKLEALKAFDGKLERAVAAAARARGVDLLLARTRVDAEAAGGAGALASALSGRAVWFASERVPDLTDAVLAEVDAGK